MGRRPSRKVRMVVTLRLDPLLDAAVLRELQGIPPGRRAGAILQWVRAGFVSQGAGSQDGPPGGDDGWLARLLDETGDA